MLSDIFAYALMALLVLNFLTFLAFAIDKAKAVRGARRIRESTLLTFAALGGTPGAYAGRSAFRHKTRKQPFVSNLHAIAVFQAFAVAIWLGWSLGG